MKRGLIFILAAMLIGSSISAASEINIRPSDAAYLLNYFRGEINNTRTGAQGAQSAADLVCCEQQYDCGQGSECRTSYAWMPSYACTKVYNGTESSSSNCGK
jgi:hypothetical protein